MYINCSEGCIHEKDGLCTLDHIINSSGESSDNCPYYVPTHNHKNEDSDVLDDSPINDTPIMT